MFYFIMSGELTYTTCFLIFEYTHMIHKLLSENIICILDDESAILINFFSGKVTKLYKIYDNFVLFQPIPPLIRKLCHSVHALYFMAKKVYCFSQSLFIYYCRKQILVGSFITMSNFTIIENARDYFPHVNDQGSF